MSRSGASTRWPDVYIVGAGRSGTTSLHEILRQHSQLRVCDHKSPNFFVSGIEQPEWETPAARLMAKHWTADAGEYLAMFSGARPEQVLVEASPVYLQALGVAERIRAVNANAKIVAILRDPADRAFAHFSGRRRDGIEPAATFGEWMDRMSSRPLPDDVAFGHYIGCGRYHHFLRQYTESFGSDRVLVLFYEDFVADPIGLLRRLLTFIGVDASIDLDTDVRANRSGDIENRWIKALWTSSVGIRTRLRPLVPAAARRAVGKVVLSDLSRAKLDPHLRSEVIALLGGDIRALAQTTDRDLSSWLV